MRHCLLVTLIVILASFSLFASNGDTLSLQVAPSLAASPAIDSPMAFYMKTLLSLNGNEYKAALRAQENSADALFSTRIRFGKDHGKVKALSDTVIVNRDKLNFFTDITMFSNYMPLYGSAYVFAFSLGQELSLNGSFYRLGGSYQLGFYAHITTFEGFEGQTINLVPIHNITLSSVFGNRLFLDLSLITNLAFFYPKQNTYGFRLTAAYLINNNLSIGYDGGFLFSDYIGETEFINRDEHSIFINWSFNL